MLGLFLYSVAIEFLLSTRHDQAILNTFKDNLMVRILGLTAALLSLTACATTENLMHKAKGVVHASSTPLEQVLKTQPNLASELNALEIRQVFNRVESPTAAQVTVLESGLMDDSVSAIRTTYQFKFIDEQWNLVDKKAAYKCSRGKNTKTFQTAVCP